jgi:hypothetical protein
VRPGEDRGGRLTLELVERVDGVRELREGVGAVLEEGLHEWPVLVERGAPRALMLLEREREVATLVELAEHRGERPEAERPEGLVEMRRADHASAYAPGECSPFFGLGPGWQLGHQYAVRLSSPCPHDSIGVRQRGQGRPAAR